VSALHASDLVWVTPPAGTTGRRRKGTIAGFIRAGETRVLVDLANGDQVQVPVRQVALFRSRLARR
jgi:hypothetical protein